MGKFLLEEAGKMVCEAMCRESHVLDIFHTLYIFDVQRGLDHNYIGDFNHVKSLYKEKVYRGGPWAGSG